jgi:hypothetical protein
MKRFTALFSACILSGFLLLGCERDSGVQAGNEEFKPRPAPTAEVPKKPRSRGPKNIVGELTRVDPDNKTIVVRLDNGTMLFKYNDCTEVEGLDQQTFSGVRSLVGKEGSDVTVQWADVRGLRLALLIEVSEVGTPTNPTTTSGPTDK